MKKASQVIYLHLALKKRAIIEEFHEKQEQVLSLPLSICLCIWVFCHNIDFHLPFKIFCKVKEWLQHIGLGDHTTVVHDADEPDDGAVPIFIDDSAKNR